MTVIDFGLCEHKSMSATVDLTRLTDVPDGPVTGYTADLRVHCEDCGLPFHFPETVPVGMSLPQLDPSLGGTIMRSPDGDELRMPIYPGLIDLIPRGIN